MNRDLMRDELARDEGRVPHVYPDSLGYATIGVGHLVDRRKGGRLSERIIDLILDEDIDNAIAELDRDLPWWRELSDTRQRVLVNMTFNLGISKLLKFKNTLAAIKSGRWADAKRGMLSSLWAAQVGERAKRLADMILHG